MEEKIVKLNIGGVKFWTTSTVLLSSQNFFVPLLNGKFKVAIDDEGFIFIDRNGELFKPILDFLRTGFLNFPKDNDPQRILEEMEYYAIHPPLCDAVIERKISLNQQQKISGKVYLELKEIILEQLEIASSKSVDLSNVASSIFVPNGTIKRSYEEVAEFAKKCSIPIPPEPASITGVQEISPEKYDLLLSASSEIMTDFARFGMTVVLDKYWIGWRPSSRDASGLCTNFEQKPSFWRFKSLSNNAIEPDFYGKFSNGIQVQWNKQKSK
jgi:hypothetical protein